MLDSRLRKVSRFLMWPLTGKGEQLRVKPFDAYLDSEAMGLQTRQLTHFGTPAVNQQPCDTELAIKRLASFDLACSLRLINVCLEALASEHCLSARAVVPPHAAPASLTRGGLMFNASRDEVANKTSTVVSYERMRRAASCDQQLMDREFEWMQPTLSLIREQGRRGVARRSVMRRDGNYSLELACTSLVSVASHNNIGI